MTSAILREKLRRGLPLFIVLTAVLIVVGLVQILTTSFSLDYTASRFRYSLDDGTVYSVVDTRVDILLLIASVIALVLPIYTFSYRYRRRSEDIVFSLPVKRKTLIGIEILTQYIQLALSYTIGYFLYVLLTLSKIHDGLFYPGFLLFYLVALVLLGVYLLAGCTIALISRTALEAVLIHIVINVALYFVSSALNSRGFSFISTGLIPIMAIYYFTNLLAPTMGYAFTYSAGGTGFITYENHGVMYSLISGYNGYLGGFLSLLIIALMCGPVIVFLTERQKSEDSGSPNRSPFGIRTVLPVCFCVISVSAGILISLQEDATREDLLVVTPVILIAHIVVDLISRKKIRFTWDLLVGLVADLACLIPSALIDTSEPDDATVVSLISSCITSIRW